MPADGHITFSERAVLAAAVVAAAIAVVVLLGLRSV
ncbi:MAG: hypothetical protein QOI47_1411, partial [Actinomycetota bacterium]|nr:hypothetical protein [Actinomycetota bacterium]